jgi:hypothetical protein
LVEQAGGWLRLLQLCANHQFSARSMLGSNGVLRTSKSDATAAHIEIAAKSGVRGHAGSKAIRRHPGDR